jgi:adenosylcobinamide-phosphate synthase
MEGRHSPAAMCFLLFPALALAAAIIDVTIGYPERIAGAIGRPSTWMATWLAIVEGATERSGSARTLAVYLAPIVIIAAVIAVPLPSGPVGFAVSAVLASTLYARQAIDLRARALAQIWEEQGVYEALTVAEALGPEEREPRLARASAAAIAARFADEVAAPTVFLLIGGLTGLVFCRALGVVGRACRDRGDNSNFGRAAATLESWTLTPAARIGALWIVAGAILAGRVGDFAAIAAPAARPTLPAETAMLAALGDPPRDDPGYVRLALGMFRRAAAVEFVALAVLALAFAAWR